MTSLTNDDDRLSMTDAPRAHDFGPTVIDHWNSTVHDDLGDTVPMEVIDADDVATD